MNPQTLIWIALIFSLAALTGSCWSVWSSWSLNRLRKTFFTGRTGSDLENVLQALAQDLSSVRTEQMELQQGVSRLYQAFGFAIQKIGMVRFNPFADGGGNFSFTLALLDGHNNGVIITSLHGREQNRIYSKYILEGKSESQLTGEEQQAILIANQQK